MSVKFTYSGVSYTNAVELSKALPMLTSVLVGWYDGAELLCANAGAMCYDTKVKSIGMSNEPNTVGKGIIKHCLEAEHNTVIEHGSATFVKKVPIFVARQDLRSRLASFDERSLRYCRAKDNSLTYYVPDYLSLENIHKLRSEGKESEADFLEKMRTDWLTTHERAIETYSKYTDEELNELWSSLGMEGERVRETVRAVLPVGINTFYMDTRNLWSWVHHSKKRLCFRAQKEIRIIRQQEVRQLREKFPTIFNLVDKPCFTKTGCKEGRPCGRIELNPATRRAVLFEEKIIK